MFSDGPHELIDRAIAGKLYIHERIQKLEEMIAAYHGPSYLLGSEQFDQENTYLNFAGLFVPKLVFGDPKFKATTVRSGVARDIATRKPESESDSRRNVVSGISKHARTSRTCSSVSGASTTERWRSPSALNVLVDAGIQAIPSLS